MTKRCGLVAVLGAANTGKSTLINTLVGEKISIVTSKPHTTRNRIYGVVCRGNTQLVLVDTPGLIRNPRGPLQRYMKKTVWRTAREADVSLVLLDAHRPNHPVTQALLTDLLQKERKAFLALNKIDHLPKEALLPLAHTYSEIPLEGIFMISGRQNKGIDTLVEALTPYCPEGPWLFPEDALTQISQNFLAAEITREKIFQYLHGEIPYSVHVQTDLWHIPGQTDTAVQAPLKGISIFQTIFVEKEGQKKLIIGYGGRRLKQIGQAARMELCDRLGGVHLFLHVKVVPQWSDRTETYKTLEQNSTP